MFAAETFGTVPGIICSGKALTNGTVPMGAMMAREEMADAFKGDPEAGLNFFPEPLGKTNERQKAASVDGCALVFLYKTSRNAFNSICDRSEFDLISI